MTNSSSKEWFPNATYVELVKHYLGTIVSTRRGKLLTFIWSLGTVGSFALGIWNGIEKRRQQREREKTGPNQQGPSFHSRIDNLRKLLKPILKTAFPSKYKKQSLHFYAYSFLLLARVILTIKVAEITGKLARSVSGRKFTAMFNTQVTFGLWCIPAAAVNSLLNYECNSLALRMREELTKSIHNTYFKDLLFYKAANLGNAARLQALDQCISQDVRKFCYTFAEVYGNLLKPILEIALVSISLKRRMGGRHLLGFLAFFLLSTKWVLWVTPSFDELAAQRSQREGEFRSHHARLIGASEEIALSGGTTREKEIIEGSFRGVMRQAKRHSQLECLQNAFEYYIVKYGSAMTAYTMLIPAMYFGTHGLGDKTPNGLVEHYITCTQLFVAFGNACKALMANYKRVYALEEVSARITRLAATFARYTPRPGEKSSIVEQEIRRSAERAILERGTIDTPPLVIEEGEEISFENVDVVSPSGQLLVRKLSFLVRPGDNVLVAGPHGSGKTAIFRILAGLWPLVDGIVVKPPRSRVCYIPQRPLMVPGTFRDQVTYPLCVKGPQEDVRLAELLTLLDINYLLEKHGGWGARADWVDVLSNGEKQRIAMARMFFHRPTFGILDECVTSVSVDVEAALYAQAKKMGITLFTVSHRPQLVQYHDYMLQLDGEGSWEWTKLEGGHLPGGLHLSGLTSASSSSISTMIPEEGDDVQDS